MVEPVHPFQGCQFHRFPGFPRCQTMDQFRLVQPVHGLGQGVVIAVSLAPDRGFYAGFGETLTVADRNVLSAPVTVVDECPGVPGLKWTPKSRQQFKLYASVKR